jgi:hypothetical protein
MESEMSQAAAQVSVPVTLNLTSARAARSARPVLCQDAKAHRSYHLSVLYDRMRFSAAVIFLSDSSAA